MWLDPQETADLVTFTEEIISKIGVSITSVQEWLVGCYWSFWSVKILNVFSTLTLKQIFLKTKTFFKKLEYRFLVERTKIEKALFP